MSTRLTFVALALAVSATPAFSEDPVAIAKQHDHTFDKTTWRGGCSNEKALELYEDNAIAIYPGTPQKSAQ